MLKQATIDRLAGLAKVDATKLADAITNETEQDVVISEGVDSFTTEELTTRDSNAVETARAGIENAAVEKAVKTEIKTHGLDLPDSAKRDFSAVLTGHKEAVLKEAKIKPDERVEDMQTKLDAKDGLIDAEKTRADGLSNDLIVAKFKAKIDTSILSGLSKSEALSRKDKLTLFNSRFRIEADESGKEKVINLETGKPEQDSKLNAKPLKTVVEEFDAKYDDSTGGGRGAGGAGGAGSGAASDIQKQLESEGLSVQKDSKAYYSRYNELLKQK